MTKNPLLALSLLSLAGCLQTGNVDVSTTKDFSRQGLTLTAEDIVEGGLGKIEVSLNYVPVETVSFRVQTTGSGATAGTDFTNINTVLTIPAGQTKATVSLLSFFDRSWEENEKIIITLSDALNAEILLSTVTIDLIEYDNSAPLTEVEKIAVGRDHACALQTNGQTRCWGRNDRLQTGTTIEMAPGHDTWNFYSLVAINMNPTKIDSYLVHNCALFADGSASCWGDNTWKQISSSASNTVSMTSLLTAGSGAIDVVVGGALTCVLYTGGTVKCRGLNTNGEVGSGVTGGTINVLTDVVGFTDPVDKLYVGYRNGCAILDTGSVQCWGYNSVGGVGDNTAVDRNSATNTILPADAKELALGSFYGCAILVDDRLYCWGYNNVGQLGIGNLLSQAMPQQVNGLADIPVKVAASNGSTCVLLANGQVQCWGSNVDGQLGTGDYTSSTTPAAPFGFPATPVDIVGGYENFCVRLIDKRMMCWGKNHYAATSGGSSWAEGPVEPSYTAGFSLKKLKIWADESAQTQFGCAIASDDSTKCWGGNADRQMGRNTATTPLAIGDVTGLGAGTTDDISVGKNFACALLKTGEVKCWGINASSQMGNGATGADVDPPVTPTGLGAGVTKIASALAHSCAVVGGQVMCWGSHTYGQTGTCVASNVPTTITGITTAVDVAVGATHSCAILADGQLKCWGYNGNGELGDGDLSATCEGTAKTAAIGVGLKVTKAAVGWGFTCALLDNGGVKCWGRNGVAQLGRGTKTLDEIVPAYVLGLTSGVVDLAAGSSHVCAVHADGKTQCWGDDYYAQLGRNSYIYVDVKSPNTVLGLSSGTAKIFATNHNNCILTTDGTAKCWGPDYGAVHKALRSPPRPVMVVDPKLY